MHGEHTKRPAELVTAQSRLIERIVSDFVRSGVRHQPRLAAAREAGQWRGSGGTGRFPQLPELSP
jgi:hypothetical protein